MGRSEDLFARLKAGGEREIDDLIADRQSEELFLDFKRSADNPFSTGASGLAAASIRAPPPLRSHPGQAYFLRTC